MTAEAAYWSDAVGLTGADFIQPENIWQCLETSLVVTTGGLLARNAAKHPPVHSFPQQRISSPKYQWC